MAKRRKEVDVAENVVPEKIEIAVDSLPAIIPQEVLDEIKLELIMPTEVPIDGGIYVSESDTLPTVTPTSPVLDEQMTSIIPLVESEPAPIVKPQVRSTYTMGGVTFHSR